MLSRFAALLRVGATENARDCFPRVFAALAPHSGALASFLTAQRAVLEANQARTMNTIPCTYGMQCRFDIAVSRLKCVCMAPISLRL